MSPQTVPPKTLPHAERSSRRGHPSGRTVTALVATIVYSIYSVLSVRAVFCAGCVSPEQGCVPGDRGASVEVISVGAIRRGHPSGPSVGAVCDSCWCNHSVQYLCSSFCPGALCAGGVSPEQGCVPGAGDAVCPLLLLKKGSRFFAADCQGLARMKRGGVLEGMLVWRGRRSDFGDWVRFGAGILSLGGRLSCRMAWQGGGGLTSSAGER